MFDKALDMPLKSTVYDRLKLDANFNKTKRRIFVINFGGNFEMNFVIFVKHLLD